MRHINEQLYSVHIRRRKSPAGATFIILAKNTGWAITAAEAAYMEHWSDDDKGELVADAVTLLYDDIIAAK